MNKIIFAAAAMACATPAFAQDEEPPKELTVNGSIGLVSDYRFRGVSQSDEEMAVQGGVTVTHESGFYAGFWGSNLSGWGTFGGSNMELDLIGGYARQFDNGVKVDVGLTWYMYPGGLDKTDFAEPYVKVSGTAGPAKLLVGVAYAPQQQALGNWYGTPQSRIGDKGDNLYVWGDANIGIPSTPLTLKGHLGYSHGNRGLSPVLFSTTPTGEYLDWLVGVDASYGPLTFSVNYVDTDITQRESAYLVNAGAGFFNTKDGTTIAGEQVVFAVTASF